MDSAALATVEETPSLADLATRINEEHAAYETSMKDGLRHAMEAGRLLLTPWSRVVRESARKESNLRPDPYKRPALTVELRAA
jgi:hypothetical protein